jgi:aspartate/methionine/tyrosine aminotransferase
MKIEPFQLERYYARYEFTAPFMLSSSDCESVTVADLLALQPDARAAFEALWLGYTEAPGDPALRAEIAGLYRHIAADQILVHAGAEEAIFNFMNAMLASGDHVIVHSPCYQSLAEIPAAIGCRVTRWQTSPANDWALDLDFLRDNIRPETRLVVVNCPHNPTGYLMSARTQRDLIELARQHNLLLFFDEVYRGLEFDPADTLPAAADLYENAVSLGVMSKTYGLAGLRIGWIATQNPDIYRRLAAFKDYTSICNSAPSEFLAALALRHRQTLVQRNLEIILENLGLLNQFFATHATTFNWTPPRAGSIAFPELDPARPVAGFCRTLVEAQGVLLAPGHLFSFAGNHFRIGFGRKNMPQALARLDAFLEQG